MSIVTAAELKLSYQTPGVDTPDFEPEDATLVDRTNRASVCAFINWHCESRQKPDGGPFGKPQALKAERMIRKYLPADQKTYGQISHWLDVSWLGASSSRAASASR